MEKFEKISALIASAILAVLGIVFFFINTETVEEYESGESKWISGFLEEYEVEETKRGNFYTFHLAEYSNVFTIPIPEWQSFDRETFDEMSDTIPNLNIDFEVSALSPLNTDEPVSLLQIRISDVNLIDSDVKIRSRKIEKWAALLLALFCIGVFIYYYRKS